MNPAQSDLAGVARLLASLASGPEERLFLGFSGGLDSTVLLHLAARHCPQKLQVLHVNHGLHALADAWQEHCRQVCLELDLPFAAVKVTVVPEGEGLEAAARFARYQVFDSRLESGDLLLLAHHADDQLETILFRLLRGGKTGSSGGMPGARSLGRGRLLRPLLGISRSQLLDYAEQNGLSWVEDPGNQSLAMDRNYLRHKVLPMLRSRWPGVDAGLNRLGSGIRSLEKAAKRLFAAELASLQRGRTGSLNLLPLQDFEPALAREVFALWLQRPGMAQPGERKLDEMLRQLLQAALDRNPAFSLPAEDGSKAAAFELHRHAGEAWLLPEEEDPRPVNLSITDAASREAETRGGLIRLFPGAGPGISLTAQNAIQVRFRRGGESIVLARGKRTLKRLLQEAGVPVFLRRQLPLLTIDGELAAIPGLGIAEKYSCREGGWQFAWFSNIEQRWWQSSENQTRRPRPD